MLVHLLHHWSRLLRSLLRSLIASGMLLGPASAEVTFTLNKSVYQSADDGIVASWTRSANESIYAKDWIGLYTPTQEPTTTARAWLYLNGTKTAPNAGVRSGSITLPMLPAGSYIARIFSNDQWTQIAKEIPFVIQPGVSGPPAFSVTNAELRHAVVGKSYQGCIRGYAKDPNDVATLSFRKVSGPAWLSVAADGTLSGMPTLSDRGRTEISVRVTDRDGAEATASFHLSVFTAGTERVDRLNVMSYNLFHGWSRVSNGFAKGMESILLADADVVCVVESSHGAMFRPQQVAKELGWYYAQASGNGDVGVLSRYPIMETFPADCAVGARIRVSEDPLREVVVYSAHLDYLHYGPYEAAQQGSTKASVLAEELKSRRKTQSVAMIAALQKHLDEADLKPVIVAGDFNCPSHLDWTEDTAAFHSGKAIEWPATIAMEKAGLIDTYRQIHRDPKAMPGNTWAPVYSSTEPQDRIDFIFYKGRKLRPLDSRVFTTKVETVLHSYNKPGPETIMNNTWPSDHAAVVTEFRLLPGN